MNSNARALACLQQGDVERCVLILKHELSRIGSKSNQSQSSHLHQDKAEDDAMTHVIRCVPIASESIWGPDGNLFSFYPRAFELQYWSDNHAVRMPVILLYNLGLAYQVAAASQRDQGRLPACHKTLKTSVWLYRQALDLANMSWGHQDFRELRCLLMACLNNTGYIHSHLLDHDRACRCIRMLCELANHEAKCYAAVPLEDFKLFFNSIYTYMHGSYPVLAPAA